MWKAVVLGLGIAMTLPGCATHTPERAQVAGGAQTYAGNLPCADCPGIDVVLTLFPNGTYRLRQTYRERPGIFYELGRWSSVPESGDRLRLTNSTGVRDYRVLVPDRLRQLDREGHEIQTPFNTDLVRQAAIDPLGGPLPLRGLFSHQETASTFYECETGQRFAIDSEHSDAFDALERAWRALGPAPGAPVFALVSVRFETRSDGAEVLRIEQFDRLAPGQGCASNPSDTALLETRWRPLTIRGRPVVAESERRAPYFMLADNTRLSGFTGCNRLSGDYAEDETRLRLRAIGTTRMACPGPAQALENAFLDALNASRVHRMAQGQLELLDDSGVVLMRLQAQPQAGP